VILRNIRASKNKFLDSPSMNWLIFYNSTAM
jgi:hypothetical protein